MKKVIFAFVATIALASSAMTVNSSATYNQEAPRETQPVFIASLRETEDETNDCEEAIALMGTTVKTQDLSDIADDYDTTTTDTGYFYPGPTF